MADTKIQKQGRIYISESEYNTLRLAGKLQPNTEYCITKATNKGGTVEGSLVITGDLTVQGKTTSQDIENVSTKQYLITLAEGNTAALTAPAGLRVPNYDGEGHDGALVFDSTGTAYVGDVVINNGNINTQQSDLQPLATRTGLVNGNLVKWDDTNATLTDSGKTVEDFVPKIKNEDQNFKCYVEQGLTDGSSKTMTLQATIGDFSNSIIQRDADGRAKINTPTTDLDGKYIVNKKYVEDNFVAKYARSSEDVKTYVYGTAPSGEIKIHVANGEIENTLVMRDANKVFKVGTPTDRAHVVNKGYVEDNFVPKTTTAGRVYATDDAGNQKPVNYTHEISANSMMIRDGSGRAKIQTPLVADQIANKGYVDDNFISKYINGGIVYANDTSGSQTGIEYSETADKGTIAIRDESGHVRTADPVGQNDAVNKSYAEANFVPKTTTAWRVYATGSTGNQGLLNYTAELGGNALIIRDADGRAKVQTPVDKAQIANKGYVDDGFVAKVTTAGVVYCTDGNGNQSKINYANIVSNNTVVTRDANGHVRTADPKDTTDAVNKSYAEANFVAKLASTDSSVALVQEGTNISGVSIYNYPSPQTVPKWDDSMKLYGQTTGDEQSSGASTEDIVLTNKKYVEDNFVPKIKDNTTGDYILYAAPGSGRVFTPKVNSSDGINQFNGPDFIPKYGQNCQLYALTDGGEFPASDEKACLTNKQYVEDNFVAKVSDKAIVYGTTATDGTQRPIPWNTAPVPNTVVMRDSNGRTKVATPSDQADAVNKSYADTHYVERKVSTQGLYAYCFDTTGITKTRYISEGFPAFSLVERDEKGRVRTADPEGQNDAVNKGYAEANFVPIKPSNFDTTTEYDTEGAYCFTYTAKDKTFTPVCKNYGLGSNNLPIYNNDATLTVATPNMNDGQVDQAGNAASDTYVKENFVLSEFGHAPSQPAQDLLGQGFTKLAYVADFDVGGNVAIALSDSPTNGTIALRTSMGQLSVGIPTKTYHAANKEYVDDFQTIIILGAND